MGHGMPYLEHMEYILALVLSSPASAVSSAGRTRNLKACSSFMHQLLWMCSVVWCRVDLA